jgi:hypothetical protein
MKLNTPKIDSLRLLIPIHLVQINPFHSEFLRDVITINSDAEVIEEKHIKSYRLHENPCSSHYNIAKMIDNGTSIEVIKIGFSAKTLKAFYFDGIDKVNINDIIDFINSEGVLKVSKRTILQSRVVDTDICIDYVLDSVTTEEFFKFSKSISSLKKETIPNLFNDLKNKGIEWSKREKVGKAYKTKQYLKFYDKYLELNNNSKKFYDAYLKNNPFVNLVPNKQVRVETTIKNSAHWDTYGVEVKTLNDLLNLDLSKHLEIFERPINNYLDGNKTIKHSAKLSPGEKKDLLLIESFMKAHAVDEINAIEMICNHLFPLGVSKNRNPRSRERIKLSKLLLNNKKETSKKLDKRQLNIITELEKMGLK